MTQEEKETMVDHIHDHLVAAYQLLDRIEPVSGISLEVLADLVGELNEFKKVSHSCSAKPSVNSLSSHDQPYPNTCSLTVLNEVASRLTAL